MAQRDSSRVDIVLSDPVVVATSPPGETRWGFYQFPKMWRGGDGRLYLAMHVGADSPAGRHEPTQYFASADEGISWDGIDADRLDRSPQVYDMPDGGQVSFGWPRRVDGPREDMVDVVGLGLKPAAGPFGGRYRVNERIFYCWADVPAELRCFPAAERSGPGARWRHGSGAVEMPELLLTAMHRAGWWDDEGKFEWQDFPHQGPVPVPKGVVALADGTLLWPHASQNPKADRACYEVQCLASTDGGHTWRRRGAIADDVQGATWGYGFGEQEMALMPNGDLFCVMRTKASNEAADSHFLASTRSTDAGFTWAPVDPVAQFCVTPHLVPLRDGVVAVVYGRPGVHVKATADSARSWCPSVPVVGPDEQTLLAMALDDWWAVRHDFSCANTTVVKTGPDRFLIAYSDFEHTDDHGRRCKGIKVREAVVGLRVH